MKPTWSEYFMGIANAVAVRSSCSRRQVGAIIVKNKRIISTGYNGTPRGIKNCNEGGCSRCAGKAPSGTSLADCLCSHAEENAIVQAAYHGISVKEATLYTTFSPCLICTKMIINSGLSKVIYSKDYTIETTCIDLLSKANIIIKQIL